MPHCRQSHAETLLTLYNNRDLSAYLQKREQVANEAIEHSSMIQATTDALAELEVLNFASTRRNADLASEILELVDISAQPNARPDRNAQLTSQTSVLEYEITSNRQRWKVMKGAASAIVAGSGVDWVRDRRLRAMVLDPVSQ